MTNAKVSILQQFNIVLHLNLYLKANKRKKIKPKNAIQVSRFFSSQISFFA